MHDIAFLDDVLLALEAQTTRFFCALLTIAHNVVVIGNDLGTNKALLKISVNLAGGLGCGRTDFRGPGANFLLAGRKVRL